MRLDPLTLARALRDSTDRHGGASGLARKVAEVWRAHGLDGILDRVRRQVRVSGATWALGDPGDDAPWEPTPADRARAPAGRIGVMAHVYYPELAGELVDHLSHVPWPFTVLASVVREEDREIVERALERVPRATRRLVRVVPNRGRDLAPLLVGFRDEVQALDVVCHVHTKKSLYTGAERAGWRRHLYAALLGSEARVRAIHALLAADPRVGIVYPEPAPEMPYWGYTWLANREIAAALLPRLGLEAQDGRYLEFPAGSMFWARVPALRPLLELGLRLDDFPPEAGQTDGTLHHTLERCLVLSARRAGFTARVVEAHGERHRFFAHDHRNLHQYLAEPVAARIARAAEGADVVSLDVFDTLLVRPYATPEGLLRELGARVEAEDGVGGFVVRRRAAEAAARAARPEGDVSLAEIYAALAAREGLAPEAARRLMARELEAEARALRPRPEVVDAARRLRAAGKRVVAVSDMYLDAAQLRSLLAGAGIDFLDAVYVSSEVGLRKDRDGALFDHVLRAEGVSAARLQHVGDNERSDVQVLVDRRHRAPVHVLRPLALLELLPEGRQLLRGRGPARWPDELVVGLLANELALAVDRDPADARGPLLADPGRLGFCALGPAVLQFLCWLARRARDDGVRRLEFLSREGFVLRAAWERLRARLGDPRLPPSGYLLASRRAAGMAALRREADLAPLLSASFRGTLEELLRLRLGVEPGPYRAALGRSLRERVVLPRDGAHAAERLRPAWPLLRAAAAAERDAYLAYLGPRLSPGAAVVDVGYGASIQAALMRLLEAPVAGYYLATTAAARAVGRAGGRAAGCFGEHLAPDDATTPALRHGLVLEAILTAPDGQLLRFERAGADVRPTFKPPGSAQRRFAELARIHAGLLRFIDAAVDALGPAALAFDADPALVQRPLALVATGGWPIGALEPLLAVEDEWSGNGELQVVPFYARQEAVARAAAGEGPGRPTRAA